MKNIYIYFWKNGKNDKFEFFILYTKLKLGENHKNLKSFPFLVLEYESNGRSA